MNKIQKQFNKKVFMRKDAKTEKNDKSGTRSTENNNKNKEKDGNKYKHSSDAGMFSGDSNWAFSRGSANIF